MALLNSSKFAQPATVSEPAVVIISRLLDSRSIDVMIADN